MTENNFQIDSAAVSDKGLSEKRPQNEDSYLEMNERGLFVVADGVGGAQAGDVASQMAVEILGEAFTNLRENGDAEEMMKIAVERANEAIYQMSHDLPQLSTMATTIVALHVSGNIATIGHVGDSRLYRLDAKGNLYRETQDHSVVEEEMRAGRMTARQAANHPSRNVISRALGADSSVEVDMKTIMFEPRTTFLLCSDGITRHIEDVQIRELLLSGESPANIAQKMKEICYERGAEDNLTAVIARVTDVVAGSFAPQRKAFSAEYEEPTIAAARPSAAISDAVAAASVVVPAQASAIEDAPIREMQVPAAGEIQNQKTSNLTENVVPADRAISASPDSTGKVESAPVSESRVADDVKTYRINENGGGFLGKALSSLLLLILGGLLGAGLLYAFQRNDRTPETPVITQQSPNIPYTAFENNRRNVDSNPKQYISANVAPPEDAEDFYLLGRAYLLEGQFSDAKQMFLQARDRLSQAKETNGKVLANEITMGLAIINDPSAQKEFQKDINLNKSADSQANVNLNTNQTTNP